MKLIVSSIVALTVLLTTTLSPIYGVPSTNEGSLLASMTLTTKQPHKITIPNQTFTKEQVAKMNGKDGAKAYVIYKDIVYDVSKVSEFKKGTYKDMKVGTDITKILSKLPKAAELLKKFTPVGKLVATPVKKEASVKTSPPVPTAQNVPPVPTQNIAPIATIPPTSEAVPKVAAAPTSEISLTLEQLAKFNGQDGQPAYVAVDGILYDVTALGEWTSGKHFRGIEAGKDLSEAIKSSPHGKSILSRAVIVGTLKKEN